MRILFSPQRVDVQYKIVKEVVYIKTPVKIIKVDFSSLEDGVLEQPIDYLSSAEKVDGKLIITLLQPLDKSGIKVPALIDFETDEYEEVKVKWKTREEIEADENAPKPLTEVEKLRLEIAESNTELFEMMIMMNGGMN